jgi:hypothetical protein
MRPNPDDIRKAVAEEARELGNTHIAALTNPMESWGPGRLSESNLGHRGRAVPKGRSVQHL